MPQQPKRRLLDQERDALRLRRRSVCTEKTTIYWGKPVMLYHNWRYRVELGEGEWEIAEGLVFLGAVEPEGPLRSSSSPPRPVIRRTP